MHNAYVFGSIILPQKGGSDTPNLGRSASID
jgi:hypothetical protein